jgi:hypothetical protein
MIFQVDEDYATWDVALGKVISCLILLAVQLRFIQCNLSKVSKLLVANGGTDCLSPVLLIKEHVVDLFIVQFKSAKGHLLASLC